MIVASAPAQTRIESFDPETGEPKTRLLQTADINFDIPFRAFGVEPQPTVVPVLTNGPDTNRVTIVVLSEGFTASEQSSFLVQATNVINAFLATSPFSEYKSAINAYAIFVPSNESGSDHPASGIFKDTYFNSSYDTYGISYSISIPPNDRDRTYANGFGKVDALLELVPGFDISILIINDPAYGGSGGYIPMCSVATAAREIAIHEVGHSFAGLGDEYTHPYPGFPIYEEPNTTQETRREFIKWRAWIDPQTPVPTPTSYATQIGLFEGARYFTNGWYRPKRDCKMRTLGKPFCEVCSEAIVKEIYERVRPIDSASPPSNVSYTARGPLALSVAPLKLTTRPLNIQWRINGLPIDGATNATFIVDGSAFTQATNTIKAAVSDNGPFVRNDPEALLEDSETWTILADESGPRITARFSGEVVLSYPVSATNFILQSTTSLSPSATWQNVTVPSTVSAGHVNIAIAATSDQRYFRLVSTSPP